MNWETIEAALVAAWLAVPLAFMAWDELRKGGRA